MILDYLTRASKLVSMGALWLLSAAVLSFLLLAAHALTVGRGHEGDWSYAFVLIAAAFWAIGAFSRLNSTAVALRDGFATFPVILGLIGIRFLAGCTVCIGAAIGGAWSRWGNPAPTLGAVQSSFILGALMGLALTALLGHVHAWRIREQQERANR